MQCSIRNKLGAQREITYKRWSLSDWVLSPLEGGCRNRLDITRMATAIACVAIDESLSGRKSTTEEIGDAQLTVIEVKF